MLGGPTQVHGDVHSVSLLGVHTGYIGYTCEFKCSHLSRKTVV